MALKGRESFERAAPPDLILGEAKSAGKGQIVKPRDLSQLKAVAAKLPGAVIVIAVLRGDFLPVEKRILKPFVQWGRRLNGDREPTNPVLLLTLHELMFDDFLSATWKDLGGVHAEFSSDDHTHDVRSLADTTQQIYLGLPSFDAVRRAQWERRMRDRSGSQRSKLEGVAQE